MKPLTSNILLAIARDVSAEQIRLKQFVTDFWTVIEPGRAFIDSEYLDVICEHLEAVTYGKLLRLIVNIPPRYGKSNIVTVMWPVWEWTQFPSRRFMFCSYSSGLSTQHSIKRRRILESPDFRARWGNLVCMATDQNVKTEFENTRRGLMTATSTGGTVTGKGGDTLIGDDVLNPDMAESVAERERTLDFIDHTWSSRLDDKRTGKMVFVEQRLHAQDVTAHLTKRGGWTQLIMPVSYDERTEYILPMSGRVIVKESGQLLAPERDSEAELAPLKILMGSRAYQAQYLQRPSAEEGALLKRAWFRSYNPAMPMRGELFRIWSWDTAVKEGEQNDYSVGTYWSATTEGFCLLHRVKGKMEYPALKREVMEQFAARPAQALLVEDASSGQSLIQDLKLLKLPIVPVKVDKDKVVRVNMVAPTIEAGMVFLPEAQSCPWVVDFRENLCEFPYAEHDDDVDSMTQAVQYMRARTSGAPAAGYSTNVGAPWTATKQRPDWA